MHLQVLSSGSRGNSTLIRAGETRILVDAGLTPRQQTERLEAARVPVRALHHILLTHGHLDHARCAGVLSKRNAELTVHCAERLMKNRSLLRARRLSTLPIGRELTLANAHGRDGVGVHSVKIPHDADPTVAFRFDYEGRRAVILTDMGRPAPETAAELKDPHLLVLEFNHDEQMLEAGPYPPKLKLRILGNGGHLSNRQAAEVLGQLAGPNLHTLVLAHLSAHNNTAELARSAASAKLEQLDMPHVRIVIAEQDTIGENFEV